MHKLSLLLVSLLLLAPGQARASWTTMRNGPQNQGLSNQPSLVPAFSPAQIGFFQTGGLIWGTPVIDAEGTAYVGSADKNFYAIAADGRLKWQYRLFDKADALIDSAAALTADGQVIVPGGDGYLHALDAATGRRNWTFAAYHSQAHQQGTVVNSFEGNVQADPQGRIYAGSDNGTLYALDTHGKELWHFTTGMMIWSTPALDPAGHWLAFGSLDGTLYVLDPASGQLLDRYVIGSDVKSSPATDGRRLYVGASNQRLYAFDISPAGRLNKAWDAATEGEVYASPALTPERIFVGSLDGRMYAFDRQGQLLWRFEAYSPIASSALISADGQVIFGAANGSLYALDAITGRRSWSYQLVDKPFKSNLDASVALGPDGQLWAGAYNGRIYRLPVGHCLGLAPVPGCAYGGREDTPAFLQLLPAGADAALLYEDRDRRLQMAPAQPLGAAESLRLKLVARSENAYLPEAALDPASLQIRLRPELPLQARVSSDGHFLEILPTTFWPPGQNIQLEAEGSYFDSHNWLSDRLRPGNAGDFHSRLSFATAPASGELAARLARQGSLRWGIHSLFLYYPAALETYTPAALEGQGMILVAVATGKDRLLLLSLPALPAENGVSLLREPSKVFALSGELADDSLLAQGAFSMAAMGGTIPFKDFRLALRDQDGQLLANQFQATASCLEVKGNGSGYQFPLSLVHKLCNQQLDLLASGTALHGRALPPTPPAWRLRALNRVDPRSVHLSLSGAAQPQALITVVALDAAGQPHGLASQVAPLEAETELTLHLDIPAAGSLRVFVDDHPLN